MNSHRSLFSTAEENEFFHYTLYQNFSGKSFLFLRVMKVAVLRVSQYNKLQYLFFRSHTKIRFTNNANVQLIWDYCHGIQVDWYYNVIFEIVICKISVSEEELTTSETAHKKACSQVGISAIHNTQLSTMQENIYGKTAMSHPILH